MLCNIPPKQNVAVFFVTTSRCDRNLQPYPISCAVVPAPSTVTCVNLHPAILPQYSRRCEHIARASYLLILNESFADNGGTLACKSGAGYSIGSYKKSKWCCGAQTCLAASATENGLRVPTLRLLKVFYAVFHAGIRFTRFTQSLSCHDQNVVVARGRANAQLRTLFLWFCDFCWGE